MAYKKYTLHEDQKRLTNRKGCEIIHHTNESQKKAAEVIAISILFSLLLLFMCSFPFLVPFSSSIQILAILMDYLSK